MSFPFEFLARFESRVARADGDACWLWTAGKDRKGYGAISLDAKMHKAHRVAYQVHRGAIPAGMLVCHRCDVPACCNPEHLFLGTHADNTADMVAKGRANREPRRVGVNNPASKVTPDAVRQIRELKRRGVTGRQISRLFGIAESQVSNIVHGRHWRHV